MVNGADASDACLQTFRQTDSSAIERGAFAEIKRLLHYERDAGSSIRFLLSEGKILFESFAKFRETLNLKVL